MAYNLMYLQVFGRGWVGVGGLILGLNICFNSTSGRQGVTNSSANRLTIPTIVSVRYGLVVRIPGSHPGGPGSIPGNGIFFLALSATPMSCASVQLHSTRGLWQKYLSKKIPTKMGFEPTRAEPIGFFFIFLFLNNYYNKSLKNNLPRDRRKSWAVYTHNKQHR